MGNRRQANRANRSEGSGRRRVGQDARRGTNPLKGEPWTWQQGEINLQRSTRVEDVEGVRNAEDGWQRAMGARCKPGGTEAAKREGNPKEGALVWRRTGAGTQREDSEGERSSREDEPVLARARGTAAREKPPAPTETARAEREWPTRCGHRLVVYNTLKSTPTSREAALPGNR